MNDILIKRGISIARGRQASLLLPPLSDAFQSRLASPRPTSLGCECHPSNQRQARVSVVTSGKFNPISATHGNRSSPSLPLVA